jgi:hypothetical protein
VTFLKEKNDTGLEWRRAGKARHAHSNKQRAGSWPLFIYSCAAHIVSPLYKNNKERSFSSASSSSNKSEHLKKRVSSRGSFNAFANFDEATKASGRPSFVVVLTLLSRGRANCSIVSFSAQRTNHCRARFMNLAPGAMARSWGLSFFPTPITVIYMHSVLGSFHSINNYI